MKTVENLISINECSGCEACIHTCPKHILEAGRDENGFVVPHIIDADACIDCGRCIGVCQVHQHRCPLDSEENRPLCYVAQSLDVKNSKRSASGGAFWTIASWWIKERKGVVCGAAFDDKNVVRHILVDNLKNLRRLQGSKYVQSIVGDIFQQVKNMLDKGVPVLFSGTPCQVRGLELFLNKKYDALLTIDIVCHGVASPGLLQNYIRKVEESEHRICSGIRFRCKSKLFKSGSPFIMLMKMNKGLKVVRAGKRDPYLNVYLSGYAFRESCYRCQFACPQRVGDITIGDCDSHGDYPDFHATESNSSILLNSERAKILWGESLSLCFDAIPLNLQREIECNKQLRSPFPRPSRRDTIYQEFCRMSYPQLMNQYGARQSFIEYAKNRIRMIVPFSTIMQKRHGEK